MRDYSTKQRERLPIVTELFALGFTHEHIAEAIGVSLSTIRTNDLPKIAAKFESIRPKNEAEAFPGVLKRWLELRHSDKPGHGKLRDILGAWLEMDELHEFANGVELTMQTLRFPDVTPAQEPYLKLVNAVVYMWDENKQHVSRDPGSSSILRSYLEMFEGSRGPIPGSRDALRKSLLCLHIRAQRGSIAHVWPNDGTVEQCVEITLKSLPPKETRILHMRFGLGEPAQTRSEAAAALKTNPNYISALEQRALRSLRHPSCKMYFKKLVEPVGVTWEQALREETARRLRSPEDQKIAIQLKPLLTNVAVLQLSVRSANALQNANIECIGQLIQMEQEDLLNLRSFGRKCLNEIKEQLMWHGNFKLGTHLEGKLKDAFDAAINGRKS